MLFHAGKEKRLDSRWGTLYLGRLAEKLECGHVCKKSQNFSTLAINTSVKVENYKQEWSPV